jgi:hypothetical protein
MRPLPALVGMCLSPEEWADCRRSAIEMTRATGTRVFARDVAIQYAIARDRDKAMLSQR